MASSIVSLIASSTVFSIAYSTASSMTSSIPFSKSSSIASSTACSISTSAACSMAYSIASLKAFSIASSIAFSIVFSIASSKNVQSCKGSFLLPQQNLHYEPFQQQDVSLIDPKRRYPSQRIVIQQEWLEFFSYNRKLGWTFHQTSKSQC